MSSRLAGGFVCQVFKYLIYIYNFLLSKQSNNSIIKIQFRINHFRFIYLLNPMSSLSHLKFVCLHFKLIVSQSFILVVKNLSQVRMFSRKLSTIYSHTVNCPQNWKDFIRWSIFWILKKQFLASLSILSIKIKLNSWENIQM